MKSHLFNILFLLIGLNNVCLARTGMVATSNVNIMSFPTMFANLITNKDAQTFLNKGFIDVTKKPYSAFGDGVHDDTQAIQDALNDGYNGNYVVFFPGDKVYLVSGQLKCMSVLAFESDGINYLDDRKFGFQLLGSTKGKKPVIKLNDFSYSISNESLIQFERFTAQSPTNLTTLTSQPSMHYSSQIRGIDIDLGNNSTVNGISMDGAQYCSIEDVKIYGKSFKSGINNLPGSGGFVVNVTVTGGEYGIAQSGYRPNPTVNGLTLINQSVAGVNLTSSRGPLIITGFKIVGPTSSTDYNAVIANCGTTASDVKGSLCLTDGTIEMPLNASTPAINNIKQSVTINNVYLKSSGVLVSSSNAAFKLYPITSTGWNKISNYIFAPSTDLGSVCSDFTKSNNPASTYQFNSPVETFTQAIPDFVAKHGWSNMPSWEDAHVVDITAFGATPDNVNATDDDAAIIQAAIDAVTTVGSADFGKVVFIPRGHYHIDKALNFKSGLKIIGAGKGISVIQGLKDRVFAAGEAMIQTEDNANGNLIMSDFAILPYPFITSLNVRTNNTIFRDIITEAVPSTKYIYPANNNRYLNKPERPYFSFTNNAGGKIFGMCTDQIISSTFAPIANGRFAGYHFIDVTSKNRLTFYQLSIEHLDNSPQVLLDKAKNVSIFGFKYEYRNELIRIVNASDSIQIIGGSGNYGLDQSSDEAIIVVRNSKNILIQNMCYKKYIGTGKTDLTTYWLLSDKDNVSGINSILEYKIGNIALTGVNNPTNNSNLKVFKNEITEELIIKDLSGGELIEVYNIQGIKVLDDKANQKNEVHLNIANLGLGLYIVKVDNQTFKFLR
jgi:hypothetical protein